MTFFGAYISKRILGTPTRFGGFAERLSEVAASGIGPDPLACCAIVGSSGRFSDVRH